VSWGTVKANTPTLHWQLKELPLADGSAHRTTVTGHGRRVARTIKVLQAPDWISFPGAAQLAQLRRRVRRTVTRPGSKTVEVVYVITSANHRITSANHRAAPRATLVAWVPGHWAIENKLHWVRDVTSDGTAPRSAPATRPA
jgi:hypothetical protein